MPAGPQTLQLAVLPDAAADAAAVSVGGLAFVLDDHIFRGIVEYTLMGRSPTMRARQAVAALVSWS